ncbi:DUF1631 domain-containing protein [Chitinivorax sp. PXF-14]|uniref:DUF1631 domain-containing protein n=1 Tax=Chitinivorax sp. PXF-14 TaxID=3230488 RepID=UPI00346654F3
MNNTAPNKVVSLSDYDKARKPVAGEQGSLLSECRDMAAELLSKSLGKMLDRIEESLFELAEKALSTDVRQMYMEARSKALEHRSGVEAEFRRNFLQGFNKRLSSGDASSFNKIDFSKLELSLVDADDFEASLAAADIAKRLQSNCGDELLALDRRVGELLSLPELGDEDNPMGPKAICEAFKDACNQLETGVNVKLIILKQFDQLISDDIQVVYQNLNQHLVKRNVLPVITPDMLRRRGSGAAPTARPTKPQQPAAELPPLPQAAPMAQGGEGELFSTLQQLLSRNAGGAPAGFATPPGGFPELNTGMLDMLTDLQHGNFETVLAGGAGVDVGSMLAGTQNVLHDIKRSAIGQRASQVDAMTIDIVAMLFDYIFDDRQIPDKMKALIGRLQIPVLKVAMLDKRFFSKKTHPARQLLDTLAAAAIGWNESVGEQDRLYTKIDEIVRKILAGFEDNLEIFDDAKQELDAFLSEEERLAHERAETSAKVIYDREWLEIARALAEEEVNRRVSANDMPDVIRQFLSMHWVNLLLSAYVKEGGESDTWKQGLQTMDDLIWSVQPKRSPEERMRLVGLLPNMLKRLESALDINQTPKDAREKFFAALVQCHASAIKAGMGSAKLAEAGALQSSEPIFTPPPALVAVEELVQQGAQELVPLEDLQPKPAASSFELDLISSANARQPEELIKLREQLPIKPAADADDYDAMAANLARGTWIEFRQNDENLILAKLTWVSPTKNMYVFTNREGLNAMSIKLAGLAGKLRSGAARVVTEAPLVDRAVSSMLDALQSGARA